MYQKEVRRAEAAPDHAGVVNPPTRPSSTATPAASASTKPAAAVNVALRAKVQLEEDDPFAGIGNGNAPSQRRGGGSGFVETERDRLIRTVTSSCRLQCVCISTAVPT